jgi:hypothetical protein
MKQENPEYIYSIVYFNIVQYYSFLLRGKAKKNIFGYREFLNIEQFANN